MQGIKEAALFTTRHTHKKFIIESDNLEVLQLCKNQHMDRPWEVDVLCEEIQRIASIYNNIKFSDVLRNDNLVANWLTRHSSMINFVNNGFIIHLDFLKLISKDRDV